MQSQMLYRWTIPAYPVNAQIAGAFLENIIKKYGSLKPSYVVGESKDIKTILHRYFEWDNEKAADKYRKHQALDLICNLTAVKLTGHVEPSQPIRAFISFKQDNEFVSVANVLNTPALQENMLDMAMRELETFRQKYATLEFLSDLISDIDKNIKKYQQYVDM